MVDVKVMDGKGVIVRSKNIPISELGLNCWSPIRFFGRCYECCRYKTCRYPEKVRKGGKGK